MDYQLDNTHLAIEHQGRLDFDQSTTLAREMASWWVDTLGAMRVWTDLIGSGFTYANVDHEAKEFPRHELGEDCFLDGRERLTGGDDQNCLIGAAQILLAAEVGQPDAMHHLFRFQRNGEYGFRQDAQEMYGWRLRLMALHSPQVALECWEKWGSSDGYSNT